MGNGLIPTSEFHSDIARLALDAFIDAVGVKLPPHLKTIWEYIEEKSPGLKVKLQTSTLYGMPRSRHIIGIDVAAERSKDASGYCVIRVDAEGTRTIESLGTF